MVATAATALLLRLAVVAMVVVITSVIGAAVAPVLLRLAAVATAVLLRLPRPRLLPRLRPRLLRLPRLPAPDRNELAQGAFGLATACGAFQAVPRYLAELTLALCDRFQLGKVAAFKAGSLT
jgi:hypothetical protein